MVSVIVLPLLCLLRQVEQCVRSSNFGQNLRLPAGILALLCHVFRSTQTPRACKRSFRGRGHTVVNLADALGR